MAGCGVSDHGHSCATWQNDFNKRLRRIAVPRVECYSSAGMKLLVDTNIIIPMEPASTLDFEVNTPLAMEFHRLSARTGNPICVHPAVQYDLDRDSNHERSSVRRVALGRFDTIRPIPSILVEDTNVFGTPIAGTNDWVDNELLKALAADAVD